MYLYVFSLWMTVCTCMYPLYGWLSILVCILALDDCMYLYVSSHMDDRPVLVCILSTDDCLYLHVSSLMDDCLYLYVSSLWMTVCTCMYPLYG